MKLVGCTVSDACTADYHVQWRIHRMCESGGGRGLEDGSNAAASRGKAPVGDLWARSRSLFVNKCINFDVLGTMPPKYTTDQVSRFLTTDH